MYTMSERAIKNIEDTVGLPIEKIRKLTIEEEIDWVEKRSGKKTVFSKEKKALIIGRGNPLLARKRIRTVDDLNALSKKYIGV